MEQSANFPSFLPAKNLTDKWEGKKPSMGKQTYKKNFAAALKKLEDTYHADVDLVKNTMAATADAELNNPDYVAMFGQRLKAERKSKNITLDQEADQLGINRTTILDMENNPNRKKVNREYLYAVSLFFQNSPWYFLYKGKAPVSANGTNRKDCSLLPHKKCSCYPES